MRLHSSYYSSTFDNLAEVSRKLLAEAGMEDKMDHVIRFSQQFNLIITVVHLTT